MLDIRRLNHCGASPPFLQPMQKLLRLHVGININSRAKLCRNMAMLVLTLGASGRLCFKALARPAYIVHHYCFINNAVSVAVWLDVGVINKCVKKT